METNKALDVLRKQLEDLIRDFTKERNKHKHRGLYLKLSTAGLAAAATVLLGWQDAPAFEPLFKNLALVANALITLFAAYEAFFEPKKLWVRETVVLNKLRDVRRELDIEVAPGELAPQRLRAYQDRIDGALKESLDAWLKDKSASPG